MMLVRSLIGELTGGSLGSDRKVNDTLGTGGALAVGETAAAKAAGEETTAGKTTAVGGEGQAEQQGQQESIVETEEMEETLGVRGRLRFGAPAPLPKARSWTLMASSTAKPMEMSTSKNKGCLQSGGETASGLDGQTSARAFPCRLKGSRPGKELEWRWVSSCH